MPFKYNALLGLGLDNTIPLDGAGKIPSTFLPSYVDDVEEYNNLAAFPATGETGKIYVAINTGFVYRWSGSVYVQIGITAAAGSTTQVQFNDAGAFGGDAGLTYDKSTDALTSGSLSVTSAGAAATPSLAFAGDPNTGIFSPGADQLAISTGGTGRLFITSAGLVGIGTSSPGQRFELSNGVAQFNGGGIDGALEEAILFGNTTFSTVQKNRIRSSISSTQVNNILSFEASTGTTGSYNNNQLVLKGNGNVGIGSTTPQGRFESAAGDSASYSIIANNSFSTGDQNYISLNASTTQMGSINRVVNNIAIKSNYDGIVFWTGTGGTATQKATIDSSGRLLVGTSTARSNFFNTSIYSPGIQLEGASNQGRMASIVGSATTGAGGSLILGSQISGAVGGNTAVISNGELGIVSFQGNDGTDFVEAASITCLVDGTPGANDMPGRLVFSTTADGGSSPTEQMRLDSSGNLKFNSGYGSVATAYGCRAWVSFDSTVTPISIRGSGNVSSITDHAVGDFSMNFSIAMPDSNYSSGGWAMAGSGAFRIIYGASNAYPTASAIRFNTANSSLVNADSEFTHFQIFR